MRQLHPRDAGWGVFGGDVGEAGWEPAGTR